MKYTSALSFKGGLSRQRTKVRWLWIILGVLVVEQFIYLYNELALKKPYMSSDVREGTEHTENLTVSQRAFRANVTREELDFPFKDYQSLPLDDMTSISPNYPAEAHNMDDEVAYINRIWKMKEAKSYQTLLIAIRIPKSNNKDSDRIMSRWNKVEMLWSKLPSEIHLQINYYKGDMAEVLQQIHDTSFSWVLIAPALTYVHVKHLTQRLVAHVDSRAKSMYGFVDVKQGIRLEPGIVLTRPSVAALLASPQVEQCSRKAENDLNLVASCWPQSGMEWTPLLGMHPSQQTLILSKIMDSSLFSEYPEAMQAIPRLPLTFGNTTSDHLFEAQLAADTETAEIPKILHHIWIGPKELGKDVVEMATHCREMHEKRGWKYMRWGEEEIEQLDFVPYIEAMFKRLKIDVNYHVYSNMIRLFILHMFGGVYVDIDAYCIKPFDALIDYGNSHQHDLIAGFESPRTRGDLIANGIIIAIPSSRSLSAAIAQVGYSVLQLKEGKPIYAWQVTGPMLLTKVNRHWKSWVNGWKIFSQAAFIPVHFTEKKFIKSFEWVSELAKRKGSYTIQLFRGTGREGIFLPGK